MSRIPLTHFMKHYPRSFVLTANITVYVVLTL